MRKVYIYIIGFFAMAALLTTCYYMSYRAALHKLNYNVVDQGNATSFQQNDADNTLATAEEDAQEVDAVTIETVTPYTKCILETYDIKTDKTITNQLTTPEYLVGLTRSGVIDYINSYVKDMPLEEYQKGLISYELISFSNKQVLLRKTYNSDYIQYKYYVAVVSGEVVVYYSDKQTVYEYTGIKSLTLPEEEQIKLNYGIYVKDLEELYGILENYSS